MALTAALCALAACGDDAEAPGASQRAAAHEEAKLPNALGAPGTGSGAIAKFGRRPSVAERAAIERAVDDINMAIASGKQSGLSLTGAHTAKTLRLLEKAKVTAVKVKGDNALAVYTSPGPRWNMMPLQLEGGAWRLGTYGEWSVTGTPSR